MDCPAKRRPFTHTPLFDDVALNITYQCNLACVGCNRGGFIKPSHGPSISVERISAFLQELQASPAKPRKLRIVGAEPTLHPDFAKIVSLVAEYVQHAPSHPKLWLFSNRHSKASQRRIQEAKTTYPFIRVMGARKAASTTFGWMTRHIYVSPRDAGLDCTNPCPIMGGRGTCGYGVDPTGYYLCPVGGTLDSLLGLHAGATSIAQMLDREFVAHQSKTLCSECGNYMNYRPRKLPAVWDCNGTPMSVTYHSAVMAKQGVVEIP